MSEAKGWRDLPIGGVVTEAGNAELYNTGSWRSFRPILDKDKCINCLTCWIMCPESSVVVKDQKIDSINLFHCKGCGICARECPEKVNAITMVEETGDGAE